MSFTIHLPHWLAFAAWFVGGVLVGALGMRIWMELAIIDAIGSAFGW